MLKNDIKLEIHYEKIVTEQPGYKDKIISKLPLKEAIKFKNSIVSLPISSLFKERDLTIISDILNNT